MAACCKPKHGAAAKRMEKCNIVLRWAAWCGGSVGAWKCREGGVIAQEAAHYSGLLNAA